MVEDGGETNTREPLKRYVKQMNFPYSYIYIKTYIHNTNTCTSINHFMKVHFMTLHFYKRPTVRNSKRIFNFMKKKKKRWKQHSAFVRSKPLQRQCVPQTAGVAFQPPSPSNYTQHLSIGSPVLNLSVSIWALPWPILCIR